MNSEESGNDGQFDAVQRNARAVFIVGASSVGKTTLCRALAEALGVEDSRHIREVARHVMKTQGFTRDDTHEYTMQHAIMTAQLEAEKSILKQAVGPGGIILLSDRSAVDPIVYAATADVEDSTSNFSRLLSDTAFQATLPFYRQSLFGMCRMF